MGQLSRALTSTKYGLFSVNGETFLVDIVIFVVCDQFVERVRVGLLQRVVIIVGHVLEKSIGVVDAFLVLIFVGFFSVRIGH